MNDFNWESFLKEESRKAIAKYQEEKNDDNCSWRDNIYLPPEVIESEWLGLPGATEEQIIAAENRLGVKLPPSYREFFKVTNGWRSEYPETPVLRSVEKIDWFRIENQDLIDTFESFSTDESISDEEYFTYGQNHREEWIQPLRIEYLQSCLQISDDDDNDVVLLNPKVIQNSEWEAWFLSLERSIEDIGVYRTFSFQKMLETFGMLYSWGRDGFEE